MVDGLIGFTNRKQGGGSTDEHGNDAAVPVTPGRPEGKQHKKTAPGTTHMNSDSQMPTVHKEGPDERYHNTITVKIPAGALNNIIKNGGDKASASSLRDIASAIHAQDAPLTVSARSTKTFNVLVLFCGRGEMDKRAFSINNQHTFDDLAVAVEVAFEIPIRHRILVATFENNMEVEYGG